MRVGADYQLAAADKAPFREQGMLDAHLAHVEEICYLMLAGKSPDLPALLGRLDVLAGGEVVITRAILFLSKTLSKPCLSNSRWQRRRYIVAEHHVGFRHDQLAGPDFGLPAMGGDDFLRHCH
jgi:hypothetical protein